MSKFIRIARTSQTLSLAAMEEASRTGLREADIDHLFLALVINDQTAGRALRSAGIDIEAARAAVEEQHEEQLASLGVRGGLPAAGPIVFHETSGYDWSRRASDLLARAGGRGRSGDAAAVLRELVAEPSGLIDSILHRLHTTRDAVIDELGRLEASDAASSPTPLRKGSARGTTEAFIPAPSEEVWAFLTDPLRVPDWEAGIGTIDDDHQERIPGSTWQGHVRTHRPDGRPLKVRARFRRRSIEFVEANHPHRVAWRFGYPDAPRNPSVLTEFALASATGGTQVRITTTWSRPQGWRRIVTAPLRPAWAFLTWISRFQIASAISREFR